jgi:hypothetical protein
MYGVPCARSAGRGSSWNRTGQVRRITVTNVKTKCFSNHVRMTNRSPSRLGVDENQQSKSLRPQFDTVIASPG